MTMPCSRRRAIIEPMPGAIDTTSPNSVATNALMTITRLRPKRSDKMDTGIIAQAKPPVVADTVSAAVAGSTDSSSESVGSSACVA